MMDMTTIALTTYVRLKLPEEITVNGQKAKAVKDEDCDGDWIDYFGPDGDWEICIWMCGQDANIRASIDGDELDTIIIDTHLEDDLTDAIMELCQGLEEEMKEEEE